MPGIFGFYKREKRKDQTHLMDLMIQAMNHDGELRIDRFVDESAGLCLGRVSLGILNAVDQPVKSAGGECLVVFHGELYGRNGELSDPEFVLQQYLEREDACADDLNGLFHFAVIDLRQNKIKLFSDRFGLQPLYYAASAEKKGTGTYCLTHIVI